MVICRIHPSICYRNLKHFSLTPLAHRLFQSNKRPRIWGKHWQTLSRRDGEIRTVKVEQEWLSGQPGNTGGGCARAQPSTGFVPRQRQGWEEAEAAQGAPSPQHWNRNWNCAWLQQPWAKGAQGQLQGTWGTNAAPQPLLFWARLSTQTWAAAPADSPQLQGYISVGFILRRKQKHFSCAHLAVLPFLWLVPSTSNYWTFQPWKINFTLFHSNFYLSLYEWLQHGCLFGLFGFF